MRFHEEGDARGGGVPVPLVVHQVLSKDVPGIVGADGQLETVIAVDPEFLETGGQLDPSNDFGGKFHGILVGHEVRIIRTRQPGPQRVGLAIDTAKLSDVSEGSIVVGDGIVDDIRLREGPRFVRAAASVGRLSARPAKLKDRILVGHHRVDVGLPGVRIDQLAGTMVNDPTVKLHSLDNTAAALSCATKVAVCTDRLASGLGTV